VQLLVDADTVVFAVDRRGSVTSGDRTWTVHPIASEAGVLRLEIDDLVHEAAVRIGRHRVDVALRGNTYVFERPDAFGSATHRASSDGTILAPMPGTVLSVTAGIGQRVADGETLAVMEAMKMELALKAPFDGTVTEAAAVAGAQVALGARLFVVEARPAEEQ
jgi:acetyl-CoA/propionyl-CoA carboxylase, biotin carboxylase, biotin carboxyl carrier protein